jgi:hypothetical protein
MYCCIEGIIARLNVTTMGVPVGTLTAPPVGETPTTDVVIEFGAVELLQAAAMMAIAAIAAPMSGERIMGVPQRRLTLQPRLEDAQPAVGADHTRGGRFPPDYVAEIRTLPPPAPARYP